MRSCPDTLMKRCQGEVKIFTWGQAPAECPVDPRRRKLCQLLASFSRRCDKASAKSGTRTEEALPAPRAGSQCFLRKHTVLFGQAA